MPQHLSDRGFEKMAWHELLMIHNSITTKACMGECLCFALFCCWCIFCCHEIFTSKLFEGEIERVVRNINQNHYGGSPCLEIVSQNRGHKAVQFNFRFMANPSGGYSPPGNPVVMAGGMPMPPQQIVYPGNPPQPGQMMLVQQPDGTLVQIPIPPNQAPPGAQPAEAYMPPQYVTPVAVQVPPK